MADSIPAVVRCEMVRGRGESCIEGSRIVIVH